MLLLIAFAFLAGVVTVLSPCILPLLPIILSSSDGTGKQKPLGVVIGFVASFTFFTLFLSTIVRVSGIPAESLRFFSIAVLATFGASLLIPKIQAQIEIIFSKFANHMPAGQSRTGLWGGIVVGLSLGLLWTPCVGPILASVISLAFTGTVTTLAFVITLAYAVGTAIPMFTIMLVGSTGLQKVPWLVKNASNIQKAFGVLMILTAIGIFLNVDRRFQTYILTAFPSYGAGLTKLEDTDAINQQLEKINQKPMDESKLGKPTFSLSLQRGPVAPEIIPGGDWFNSEPLTLAELQGKVILIDFWTYSCINCQRTFSYLRQWHEKYKDMGLVIIGVHSPEFEFEKNPDNVAQAISDFAIPYPVVQDNEFATWKAYENRYWPAKYFIDATGRIRHSHFGEGEYDESEKVIQELLKEAGAAELHSEIDNPKYQITARTPETYLGYERIRNFASPETFEKNSLAQYSAPAQLGVNQVAYSGDWIVSGEYANPQQGSNLFLDFDAKEVFLVMRSTKPASQVKVYLDGTLQGTIGDVMNGVVTVEADTLYTLIKLETPGRHLLKLEFEDSNTELYAFTFG